MHQYCICSLVTMPPKKALRKEWKRLNYPNFCPKMIGEAAETTEISDPKQTRGGTWLCHSPASPLKSSWHRPPDHSTLLLLLCNFIFNYKQLQEVSIPAPNSRVELLPKFFWVLKSRDLEREMPTEAKGWSYPTQESTGLGATEPWEKQLLFQAHAAPPMDKKSAFLWRIWEWQSLPPLLPRYLVRCHSQRLERSGSSRAGGTLHPLWFNPERNLEETKEGERERASGTKLRGSKSQKTEFCIKSQAIPEASSPRTRCLNKQFNLGGFSAVILFHKAQTWNWKSHFC